MKQDIMALAMSEEMGPRTVLSMASELGGFENLFRIFRGSPEKISAEKRALVKNMLDVRGSEVFHKEIAFLKEQNIDAVTIEDKEYPEILKQIYDPPVVLYCKGTLSVAGEKTVAIVGTRMPTAYGVQTAERLAYELAVNGVTVVSGMARGIDEAAHRGVLKAGGRTIAVMGSGFKYLHPKQCARLVPEISVKGAVITEFNSDVEPAKYTFPRRNRIISGLSLGVVVVEAASKSGALITSDFALEQGREVFAVPGRIDNPMSSGPSRLIQNGAKLITSVNDILDEIGEIERSKETPADDLFKGVSTDEKKILQTVSAREPKHFDEISDLSGVSLGDLSRVLLEMEMKKIVKAMPGKYYVLTGKGVE